MKMLICGASGFLGQNAIRYFSNKGHTVIALVNNKQVEYSKVEKIHGNLTNINDVKRILSNQFDVILQLAASTTNMKDVIERPYIHVTDNVNMNSLLFQEAHIANVKHVFYPSCTTMYPGDKGELGVVENEFDRAKINSKYFGVATTKVFIEDLAKFWSSLGKTKYTIFRHSNIFGPYDRFNINTGHVCSATIKKVADAKNSIEVWGTGNEIRDLLPVESLMESIDLAITKQQTPYELYNVGSEIPITINNLIKYIIEISNKVIDITHNLSKPTINNFNLVLSSEKIKNQLGWRPPTITNIKESIRKTYNWALKNEAINNTTIN